MRLAALLWLAGAFLAVTCAAGRPVPRDLQDPYGSRDSQDPQHPRAPKDTTRLAADHAVPTVEVTAPRLSLAEMIELAARAVERSQALDVAHRYTRHMMFVAHSGPPGPTRRRMVYEELARVEVGAGKVVRKVRLWQHEETWRGDTLVAPGKEKTSAAEVRDQLEKLPFSPFAVRGDSYRYAILERVPFGDRALLRVGHEPTEEFATVPAGEVWLDTRDYVVLRQDGHLRQNVFMPVLLRSVDPIHIRRTRHGPIWLEDDVHLGFHFRKGSGMPERVDLRIRIHDVVFDSLPAPVVRLMNVRDDVDRRIAAFLDNLDDLDDPGRSLRAGGGIAGRTGDRGDGSASDVSTTASSAARDGVAAVSTAGALPIDPLLRRPPPTSIERAALRGDSLLGAWARGRPLHLVAVRPVFAYNRAERLTLGAGARFAARGPADTLRVEAAWSTGLERTLAEVVLVRSSANLGWRPDLRVSARDQTETFGAGRLPGQSILNALGDRDPSDYYGVRELRVEARAHPGVFTARSWVRGAEDRELRGRSLWTARGRIEGGPLLPIDPGRSRAVGVGVGMGRGFRYRPQLAADVEIGGGRLGGDFDYRRLAVRATAGPLLPGGRRLVMRGQLVAGSFGVPRQQHLYLGGLRSLRAWPEESLSGRSGYHVAGDLYLNRDLFGWLPGVPRRGLGLQVFLAGDHGGVFAGAHENGIGVRGSRHRTSLGAGVVRLVGLPGLHRIGVSAHSGVGRGDRAFAVRLTAE